MPSVEWVGTPSRSRERVDEVRLGTTPSRVSTFINFMRAHVVITFDTSPTRLALARHNAAIYGVADHIEFILGDFLSFVRAQAARPPVHRRFDVVFLSPPWGGPQYLSGNAIVETPANEEVPSTAEGGQHPSYSLSEIQPVHGRHLFALARSLTPNVALYLPRNTQLDEISALITQPSMSYPNEQVEVEEEWMGNKLKALTCYFGGLVQGQEELWDENPLTIQNE
jgi:trimethylguanosine synthase